MNSEMETAKEFAERYFVETSGACESLTNDIQARDDAIRVECMKIASQYVKKSLKSEDRDLWSDYEDKHLLRAMLGKEAINDQA